MTNYQDNNSIPNIDNNELFIKLPFLLLNKIIRELDEDIDRICFTLVCKRWFEYRDKYLWFNCLHLKQEIGHFDIEKNQYFSLNSFKDQFQRSFDVQSDCSLLVKETIVNIPFESGWLRPVSIIDFEKYELKSSHTKLIVVGSTATDFTLVNKDNIERLSKSNVNSIHFCRTFDIQDYEPLPSNITEIISYSDIKMSHLPLQLERLAYTGKIHQKVQISQLPQSLKFLSLPKGQSCSNEAFPSNLEVLRVYNIVKESSIIELPATLKHLKTTGYWLKKIHSLTLLQSLKLKVDNNTVFMPGDIPQSVTRLKLSKVYGDLKSIRSNDIPKGVKYIKLFGRNWNGDPTSIPSTVENIGMRPGCVLSGALPPTIKSMNIEIDGDKFNLENHYFATTNTIIVKQEEHTYTIKRLGESTFLVYGVAGDRFIAVISDWSNILSKLSKLFVYKSNSGDKK
ncbi:hypothetical protein PPL_11417 [Heterostelium album PN500]|uniref:F-box domain-containing protein n=1 Tax=Heterostelium pallidum (strain ATCC 26659 / Pp 5 / PN500) TaxID=670386 RepID=D3BTC4_HETP5|nr:hypothetical protein PPL_11417 [Heterostelium album PN500]EFA75341.1 hypothetical protein PPL_11417 [Heterostelium album PN500]|eukprot:XP_020427475.1 hypothetical protein PPL_11417 [Heterostelium album PN500]